MIRQLCTCFSRFDAYCNVLRSRYGGSPKIRLPFVYLDVTHRCDSACVGCSIWRNNNNRQEELTTEEILSILPALKRLRTSIVSISGGEPTLRNDLEYLVSAFRNARIAVKLNTNGLSIDRRKAESLAMAGVNVVYFSCDHPDRDGYKAIRGVDGLEQVVRSIELFRTLPKPVPVALNVTISNMNEDVIEELAWKAIKWGVSKMQFTPLHSNLQHRTLPHELFEPLFPRDMGKVKESLERAVALLRKNNIITNSKYFIGNFDGAYESKRITPCISGFLYVIIDPYGEIMPCYQYPSNINIRNFPLDEIICSEEYQKCRKNVICCSVPCVDIGSMEPSIRFKPSYIATHMMDIYREARMHMG